MKKLLSAVLIGSAMLLVACNSAGSGLPMADDPESPFLIVESSGGFVPVEFQINRLPQAVLLVNRNVIVGGPQIEIYPPPLVPSLQQALLDDATWDLVQDLVEQSGLPEIVEEQNNDAAATVADAATTVVTYYDGSSTHIWRVYALQEAASHSDPRVTALASLVTTLQNAGYSGNATAFEMQALQVMAGVPQVAADPQFANTQPWPLPVGFDEMTEVGFGWRCAPYDGDTAADLLDTFHQANQLTTWDEQGTEYQIGIQPWFTGQTACAPIEQAG
jgi:hypothetical protein